MNATESPVKAPRPIVTDGMPRRCDCCGFRHLFLLLSCGHEIHAPAATLYEVESLIEQPMRCPECERGSAS
jgi:DNA-directed RNA polymerase subunit RPC12/RpoP